MQYFRLVYKPFPRAAQGIVYGLTQQRQGYCLILIDSTAPADEQAAALRHELAHIALNHFSDTRSAEKLEQEADSLDLTDEDIERLMQYRIH